MANTPLHIPALADRGKYTDYRVGVWGDSFNWSWNRTPQEVKYLVIHHSVTAHDASVDYIAQLHKARGWGGIGYHFVITKDGMVWYVGDVGTARANVLDMNEQVIGICMVGDFTQYNPSDDQILSAHDLCSWFLTQTPTWPNLNGWEDVVGHKELQSTACPGTYWKGVSDSVYERIKNRIPYTPQTPPVDWKGQYEELNKKFSALETKYNDDKATWETDKKTLEIIEEWKTKIANSLNCGRDWPTILDVINKEGSQIDELIEYERVANLIVTKLNVMLDRHFTLPADKDNIAPSLDEFMNLETQRVKEVTDLKAEVLRLTNLTRPIDAYSWSELLSMGFKKMWSFKKGGEI